MTYASISRNLAEGIGSIFKPTYTLTIYKEFYEHPPLQFYLESLFFKLLGDNFYTERIYSVLIGFLTILILSFIIRLINFFEKENLPLFSAPFILISIPLTSWIILNNMLENTLTLFLLISFSFLILSIYKSPFFSIISGIFLFLAFFTKGPVSLFIVIFPFLYLKRIPVKKILFIFLLLILGFMSFLLIPDVLNYLKIYLKNQVLSSILGHREIVGSRFDPVLKTIKEIIVPFSFLFIISLWKKFKLSFTGNSIRYFILALSGVIPLMVSPKQMDWYVFPSFPFFSIFLSLIFKQSLMFINQIFEKIFLKLISSFVVIISIILMFLSYGKIIKYLEFHNDFKNIKLSEHKIVGVCPKSLIQDWVVIALSQRYLKFSFSEIVDSVIFSSKDCNLNCNNILPKIYKNYYICNKL